MARVRRFGDLGSWRLAVLALALGGVGCGGDDGPAGQSGGMAGSNGASGAGSGSPGSSVDACSVVTQADAAMLFGQPAVREPQDVPIVDPGLLGECVWSWDTDTSGQLLQFYVWQGEQYHADAPSDAVPLSVGEEGYMTVDDFAGIDAEWLQDGRTIVLSYFNVGPDVPELSTMVEPMKALAQQASDRL